eukprot:sb/3473825/
MNTQTIVMLVAVICALVCSVSAADDNSSNGTGFAVVTGGSSPIVMLTAALIPLVARILEARTLENTRIIPSQTMDIYYKSLSSNLKMNTQTIVMLVAVICALVCSVSAADDNSSNGTGFAVVTGGSSPIVMLTAALIPLVARYFA